MGLLNTRIANKHDTETNWNNVPSFVPLQGEMIVYDVDDNYNYERFKVGDGETTIAALPFLNVVLTEEEIDELCGVNYLYSSEVKF